jgi:ABC-2 type transport system ATP-binding protein
VGPVVLEPEPAALSATGADAERAAIAVAELARAGIPLGHFSLQQPSLDEVFLALTGHAAEDTSPRPDGLLSDTLQEHMS